MPEIAEVERARTIIEQVLKDQTIIDVQSVVPFTFYEWPQFDDPIVFKDTTAEAFATAMKGKKVIAAKRWGKYFWYIRLYSSFLPRGWKWSRLLTQ